jgi:hypothetical protein
MNTPIKLAAAAIAIAAATTVATLIVYPLVINFADSLSAVQAALN